MPTKETTVREYRERVNRVIFHIERNLDQPMNLQELAQIACFSPCHFHRIFVAFTGEPLAEYVRRLRLERSALWLVHLDHSVTDIALGAGYETSSAFGRAFLAHFGVSPSEYRKGKTPVAVKGTRPLGLTETSEENMLKPEFRKTEPIPVLFVRKTGPYYQSAGEAFETLCRFAGPKGLIGPQTRFIGVSHDDPDVTQEDRFRYDACLTVTGGAKGEGEVGLKNLPGGSYAVFLHAGPYEQFRSTYREIFGAWLPTSGKQLRDEPSFEVYLNSPDSTPPQDLRTEIWIPLQ